MFLYHNHLLPSSFHMIFTTGSQMHIYKQDMRLIIELTLAERILNSLLFYFKDQNWNSLPKNIINQVTPRCFRNRMLEHLLY